MATDDWYYQVWRHCRQKNRMHVVGVYKKWSQVEDVAKSLDERGCLIVDNDRPPFNLYFVEPILEERLHEKTIKIFNRRINEDVESFLTDHDDLLKDEEDGD